MEDSVIDKAKMEQQRIAREQLESQRAEENKNRVCHPLKSRVEGPTNEERVLEYFKILGPLTADECVQQMELDDGDGLPKVNRVAPCITKLAALNEIFACGSRPTRSGRPATVYSLNGKTHAFKS